MATSALEAAFAHHAWATLTLIDACAGLTQAQLQHEVPGTRGPIIETLAHLVDADSFDLDILEGRDLAESKYAGREPDALRRAMQRNAERWATLVSESLDPDLMVTEVDPTDGFRRDASVAMRLAGALDHGSDHRSQICTALTTLGVPPPKIDVSTYGVEIGTIHETPGTS